MFASKYGNPIISNEMIVDKKDTAYLWEIRNKRIKGTIRKGEYGMYSVNVSITDTVIEHIHDSIAMSIQNKDI